MAVLDAELRAAGTSLQRELGLARATASRAASASASSTRSTSCSRQVAGYIDDGYVRIKLKIEPGWDIEPVRLVRELIGPDMPLQVDANTAYTRDDIAHLCKLDEFDLLLIEQPLPEDDILGHAQLAPRLGDAGVPRRVDRVGAHRRRRDRARRRRDHQHQARPGRRLPRRACASTTCASARGIPVWCGGMVETGIGRAANAGLAVAARLHAAGRHQRLDPLLRPRHRASTRSRSSTATSTVPTAPGLGFELDHDFLDSITTSTVELTT